MTTITTEQKTKLVKLREQVEELSKQQDELVNQAKEITQEKVDAGLTWDFCLNRFPETVDELLNQLGLEVE